MSHVSQNACFPLEFVAFENADCLTVAACMQWTGKHKQYWTQACCIVITHTREFACGKTTDIYKNDIIPEIEQWSRTRAVTVIGRLRSPFTTENIAEVSLREKVILTAEPVVLVLADETSVVTWVGSTAMVYHSVERISAKSCFH